MARKTKETNLESDQAVEKTQENAVQPDKTQSDYAVHNRSRCGGALRTARENQGLSIQDIASRLRLGSKQIEALETDNFTTLPEPTIVRGFIRNYAKQLKINVEPLLDAYSVLVPGSNLHGLIVKPSANMKMTGHKKPKPGRYLLVVLAALLSLGMWLFYQSYIQKPHPTALSESVIGEDINRDRVNNGRVSIESAGSTEPLPEAALPAAEREAVLQTSTELTLPVAPEAATTLSPTDTNLNNAATTNLPLPVAPVAPAVLPPAAPNPNGAAKLEFSATQETWIKVVDASGREIYNKIIFAGSRESIDVTPPVNVTVGNAAATSLSMSGKSVDLAPHSRQNVAHIKLE